MNNKGVLVVVSAPSGCGKDTIISEVLKQTDDAFLSVSMTTRAMRTGEVEGVVFEENLNLWVILHALLHNL